MICKINLFINKKRELNCSLKIFNPKRLDITFCNIFEPLYELTLE